MTPTDGIMPEPTMMPEAGETAPSLRQGLMAPALLIGLQVLAGGIVAFIAGFIAAANASQQGAPSMVMSLAVGDMVAMLGLFYLVRQHMADEGRSYLGTIGWRASRLDLRRTAVLMVLIYLGTEIFSLMYENLFLTAEQMDSGAAEQMLTEIFATGSPLSVISLLVSVCLIAPLVEEVAFRGYLQSALVARLGVWAGIGLSAAAFATVHFNLALWPEYFVLGLALGGVYRLTGSVWMAIAFHAFNNSLATVFLWLGW